MNIMCFDQIYPSSSHFPPSAHNNFMGSIFKLTESTKCCLVVHKYRTEPSTKAWLPSQGLYSRRKLTLYPLVDFSCQCFPSEGWDSMNPLSTHARIFAALTLCRSWHARTATVSSRVWLCSHVRQGPYHCRCLPRLTLTIFLLLLQWHLGSCW